MEKLKQFIALIRDKFTAFKEKVLQCKYVDSGVLSRFLNIFLITLVSGLLINKVAGVVIGYLVFMIKETADKYNAEDPGWQMKYIIASILAVLFALLFI